MKSVKRKRTLSEFVNCGEFLLCNKIRVSTLVDIVNETYKNAKQKENFSNKYSTLQNILCRVSVSRSSKVGAMEWMINLFHISNYTYRKHLKDVNI